MLSQIILALAATAATSLLYEPVLPRATIYVRRVPLARTAVLTGRTNLFLARRAVFTLHIPYAKTVPRDQSFIILGVAVLAVTIACGVPWPSTFCASRLMPAGLIERYVVTSCAPKHLTFASLCLVLLVTHLRTARIISPCQ